MKQKNRALLCDIGLLATALIWGAGFIVVKESLNSISPLWLLAYRFTLAALAVTILFWKKIKKITLYTFGSGVLAGLCVYLGFLAQTVGVQYTTASKNAILTASYVVFVPFVYWIFRRKKPKSSQIIAALLCFVGVVLLLSQGGVSFTELNKGDLYTLVCGLFFAVQIAWLGMVSKKSDPIALTIVQMLTCCVVSLVAAFLWDEATPTLPDSSTMLSIAYLGLLSTAFAYLMQTVAQKYVPPAHTSIILSLECLVGCVLSVIWFQDTFTPMMWVGVAVTFVAVILSERTAAE